MTQPVSAAEAQAAVQAQLGQQAQAVTGTDSAGIYGDPAGASQPASLVPDMSRAQPMVADPEALMARIAALEAAAKANEPAPPPPPDNSLRAEANSPGWLHDLAAKIETRLSAIETKLGL
jgi:hypothetical protein